MPANHFFRGSNIGALVTSAAMVIDWKTLFTGSLAFTIALAINDGVSSSIRSLYPNNRRESAHATVVYAIVVTLLVIIIVVVVNYIGRVTHTSGSSFGSNPASNTAPRISPIIRW
jgi:uncharacterized membrane protein YbhN (UPF0104 family)